MKAFSHQNPELKQCQKVNASMSTDVPSSIALPSMYYVFELIKYIKFFLYLSRDHCWKLAISFIGKISINPLAMFSYKLFFKKHLIETKQLSANKNNILPSSKKGLFTLCQLIPFFMNIHYSKNYLHLTAF